MSQEAQLAEAKHQSEQLARELLEVNTSSRNVLKTSLMLQGLLSRFRSRRVRNAFLSGKMGVSLALCSANVLESIDILSSILLPSPRMTQGDPDNAADSLAFVSRLMAINDEEPRVKGELLPHRMTLLGWRSLLNDLMGSAYWNSEEPEGYNSDGSSMSATLLKKPGKGLLQAAASDQHSLAAPIREGDSCSAPLNLNPVNGQAPGAASASLAPFLASPPNVQSAVTRSDSHPSAIFSQASLNVQPAALPEEGISQFPAPAGCGGVALSGQLPYASYMSAAGAVSPRSGLPVGGGATRKVALTAHHQPSLTPPEPTVRRGDGQLWGSSHIKDSVGNLDGDRLSRIGDGSRAIVPPHRPEELIMGGTLPLEQGRLGPARAVAPASFGAVPPSGANFDQKMMEKPIRSEMMRDLQGHAHLHSANHEVEPLRARGIMSTGMNGAFPQHGYGYAGRPNSQFLNRNDVGPNGAYGQPCAPLATSNHHRTPFAAQGLGAPEFTHQWCPSSDDEDVPYTAGAWPTSSHMGSNEARDPEGDHTAQLLSRLRIGREVVPPPKFDGRQGTSLSSFFRSYERYFESKYEGGDQEKALKLRDFLSGTMLKVYEMNGGPTARYPVLRERMTEMFRAIRTSSKEKAYEEFNTASMKPGDSVLLHCMHLEHLAQLAFPDSQREQDRQKMRRLRETAPASFLAEVHRLGNTMAQLGHGKPKWENIKVLAGSDERGGWRPGAYQTGHDNSLVPRGILHNYPATTSEGGRTDTPVVVSTVPSANMTTSSGATATGNREVLERLERRNPTSASSSDRFARGNSPRRGSRVHPSGRGDLGSTARPGVSRGPGGDRQGSNEPARLCGWCGEPGHTFKTCYERRGLCKSCGRSHPTHTCTQIRETDRKLECPVCGGNHLGRSCTTGARPLN